MKPNKSHVVIIGGGATGALLLIHLLKKFRADPKRGSEGLKITVIEPRSKIGLGKAYTTDRIEHILNVHVEKMSAFENEPQSFLQWVEKNRDATHQFKYWPFLPRMWFGSYLQELLKQAGGSASYTHLRDRAVGLTRRGQKWVVQTAGRNDLRADFVCVATGYQDDLSTHVLGGSDPAIARHVIQPHESDKLSLIEDYHRVLVIGTGLSAIDAQRQLAPILGTPLTFLSRHGVLPHPAPAPQSNFHIPMLAGMSPLQILQVLRLAKKTYGLEWSQLAVKVRPQVIAIWRHWTRQGRRRFLSHLRVYWDSIRHTIPVLVHQELVREIQGKRLEIIGGRILSSEIRAGQVVVKYLPRAKTAAAELICDWVVLASGAPIDQSLSSEAAENGLEKWNFDLGYTSNEENIWVAGPSSKGEFWEITAIPEIRSQAEGIAAAVVSQL